MKRAELRAMLDRIRQGYTGRDYGPTMEEFGVLVLETLLELSEDTCLAEEKR